MDLVEKVTADLTKLRVRKTQLMAELTHVDGSIAELEAALRVLSRYQPTQVAPTSGGNSSDDTETTDPDSRMGRGSQKRFIEEVLSDNPSLGRSVGDLQGKIKELHGIEVSRNTISVTLTRLREAGVARLEGRYWFYMPKSDDELTEVAPQSAPVSPVTQTREAPSMEPPG